MLTHEPCPPQHLPEIAQSEQKMAEHGQGYPDSTCFKLHSHKKSAAKLTGGAKLPSRDISCTPEILCAAMSDKL